MMHTGASQKRVQQETFAGPVRGLGTPAEGTAWLLARRVSLVPSSGF
jgi:hypothetical protein